MRFREILKESVTFGVARLEDRDGQKVYSDPFMKKVEKECFVCDGKGYETFGNYTDDDGKHHPEEKDDCRYCNGKGKVDDWESDAAELNVANANAMAIQEMLGLEPDYSGAIEKEQFPEIRRRLIKLKNTDISPYTQDPTKTQGQMKSYTDDTGQSHIGRSGPTMYDYGRSHSQVTRYIDSLLSLIDFAQKNDCDVVWG